VPYAITLKLNATAAGPVIAMWKTLAARGVSDDMIRLGYPPHLTLAVFLDGANEARLRAAMPDRAATLKVPPIPLASLGLFPGSPAALFLAPVVTPALLDLQAGLLSPLAGEAVDPHYR
jgi:hypothetical protein